MSTNGGETERSRSGDSDDLPTQTVTQEGRVPGTVACKSPEKAEGRRVDHRTDIVFLCVIFYEMATGKGPYEGDTSMSVLTGPSTELWIGDLSRGEPAPLGDRYWTGIDRLVWFPDGSGLAVSSFGFGLSGHEIFE